MATDIQAYVARVAGEQREIKRQLSAIQLEYAAFRKAVADQPRSITYELDTIPGRRIFFFLNAVQDFDATQNGLRGQPMIFRTSLDGPFVMTHLPVVMWRPNAPATATNFGRWRPVSSWPLPDQVLDTDIVDISWDFEDAGSNRNFQNLSISPMFSRPDNFVPLPVPTLFATNAVISFTPTFERILFDAAAEVPTTAGRIVVDLPGYKIANQ